MDKKSICAGDSIRFSDSSSYNGGTIAQWNWGIDGVGEVQRNNGLSFFQIFPTNGLQKITLWINTENNCKSDTFYASVDVKKRPTASFTVAGKLCVDSAITYTSTSNGNGSILQTWNWEFGNGQLVTSITGNPQTTTYSTPGGGRTVLHWVTSAPGCGSDTASALAFNISPNPFVYFRVTADSFCTGSTLSFADSGSSTDIKNWQWNFGNGTNGTQALPFTASYAASGNYWVTVTATNAQGCGSGIDSTPSPIRIAAPPVINAGPDLIIPTGQQITINASGPISPLITYRWSPATNLNNPDILQPIASPNLSTRYTLVATSNGNCSSTDSMRIDVLTGIFVPNAFSPNGDGLNDIWNIPGLNGYLNSILTIYDRYGQVIYNIKGFTRPWDGTAKGKQMPSGVYYYILDLGDGSPRRNGSITLLR
jgi:gliding motility-associated-like protein